MVEKIEISIFKLFAMISGILSVSFAWATIIVEQKIFYFTISVRLDYNFLGQVVKASMGVINLDTSRIAGSNTLTLFGSFYLIGFLLSLINVKVDGKKSLEIVGIISSLILIISIVGYGVVFIGLINDLKTALERFPFFKYTIYFGFGFGFYSAIATGIFLLLELSVENQYYFTINLTPTTPSVQIKTVQDPIAQPRPPPPAPTPPRQPQERMVKHFSFCPSCGYQLKDENASFCPGCGKEMENN